MFIGIRDIQWSVDGEDKNLIGTDLLPTSIEVEFDDIPLCDIRSSIEDTLLELYGYHTNGFQYSIL